MDTHGTTFACSDPNAAADIARNVETGNTHALIVGALLVGTVGLYAVVRRGGFVPVAVLILLVLHPAWLVRVDAGHCGSLRRDGSYVVTVTGAALMLGYFVVARIDRLAQPIAGGTATEGGSRPNTG